LPVMFANPLIFALRFNTQLLLATV
jgi:hypothetical protein